MFLTKEGFYKDKTIELDIPTARYKPYTYTEKECLSLNKDRQIPCFNIQANFRVSLKNGWLRINSDEYNITDYYISDVLTLLSNECNVTLFTGYENLQYLPAYLLQDFNNTVTLSVDANKSPIRISKEIADPNSLFNGISSIDTLISSTILYDTNSNQEINKVVDENNFIYFEPTSSTKLMVQFISLNFQTNITLDSKLFSNTNISNIIKNKEIV